MNRQYGALSGLAIFLIVVNHAVHYALQVAPPTGATLQALVAVQALGVFAVPTFLFISGAFLCYAARELSLSFVRSSLARILWPYAIWSAAYYALEIAALGARPGPLGVAKSLLVGYPYHFVPLLVACYVAAPLIVRIGRTHGVALVLAIGAYQALLLLLRYPGIYGDLVRVPAWAHYLAPTVLSRTMSDWAVFFPLGLVASLHGSAVKARVAPYRWPLAAAALVLFALGLGNAFGWVWAPWARFAAPVPLMFLLPVIDRAAIPMAKRWEYLGRRSYGVYLSHFFVINVLALGARAAGLGAMQAAALAVLLLVATLPASLAFMDLCTRTAVTRRAYRYLFGIVPPPA